jgi:hypothetical protein
LVDAKVASFFIDIPTVFQGSSFQKGEPNTKGLSDIAVEPRRVLSSFSEELFNAFLGGLVK